jgi:hypothetical protein
MIVKFNDNWADEFDVEGFAQMTKEDFDRLLASAESMLNKRGVIEYGFGTNEDFTWQSVGEFRNCFTILDVTEEQENIIASVFFGKYTKEFGVFPEIFSDDYYGE